MWARQKPNSLDNAKLQLGDLQASHSWLGPSLRVKGEISGHGDLLVDGSVQGVVHLSAWKLTIGPAANLEADLTAGEVLVRGNVKGNVHAKRRIEVGHEGSVIGDLTTRQVLIQDGARFRGSIGIENGTEQETSDRGLRERESAPPKAAAAAAGKI